MSLFHAAQPPALDSDGDPISGAQWLFYQAGTSTPAAVYADNALTSSLGTTVTANGAGRFVNIYLDDDLSYRAVQKDAGGTTIRDIDPVNGASSGSDWTVDLEDFGGVADGTSGTSGTVNNTALSNAASAFSYGGYASPNYIYGPRIEPGLGGYRFTAEIDLRRIITISGLSSGLPLQGAASATNFFFPQNTRGMTVNQFNTGAGGTIANTTASTGSKIEGIRLKSDGGSDTTKCGFWGRSQFVLRDSVISNFPGTGLKVLAYSSGSGASLGNANGSYIERVTIAGVGLHGVEIEGNDANAMALVAVQVLSAQGCGIKQTGSLGNTFVAPQIDAFGINGKGLVSHGGENYILINNTPGIGASTTPGTAETIWYPTGGVASYPPWSGAGTYEVSIPIFISSLADRSFVGGGYTEGGISDISGSLAIAVGGQMSFTRDSRHLVGRGVGQAVFSNSGVGGYCELPLGHSLGEYFWTDIGGDYRNHAILRTSQEESGQINILRYRGKDISFEIDTSGTSVWGVACRGSTETFGRTTPPEYVFTANQIGLAEPGTSTKRIIRMAAAEPTSGEVARGEIILNNAPSAGGPPGWVCTTGGTLGSTAVLKAMAALAA